VCHPRSPPHASFTLPTEIWHKIFALACVDGGATGCALSLVSRRFRELSAGTRLQSVAVSGLSDIRSLLGVLQELPEASRHVRVLYIDYRRFSKPHLAQDLALGVVPRDFCRFKSVHIPLPTPTRSFALEGGRRREVAANTRLPGRPRPPLPSHMLLPDPSGLLQSSSIGLLAAHDAVLDIVAPRLEVLFVANWLWSRTSSRAKQHCRHLM
jgi:hypothetical protein